MSFTTLLRLEQKLFASAIASANNGSLPEGKAPSCREIIYVFSPAAMGPVVVVAHPADSITKTTIKTYEIRVIYPSLNFSILYINDYQSHCTVFPNSPKHTFQVMPAALVPVQIQSEHSYF